MLHLFTVIHGIFDITIYLISTRNLDLIVVFPMNLSKNVSMAGRNTTTMTIERSVPRPSSIPMSLIIGFDDVAAKVKPAVAIVVAYIKIDRKELPMALRIASFLGKVCLFRIYVIVNSIA